MKTQNLTVAFFAVGSAIKFDKKKLLRSDGSSEYYALIRLLLKNKSVSRVLLLSKSDWGRLSETQRRQFDPDGKIYDPFLMLPELSKRQKPSNIDERRQYFTNREQHIGKYITVEYYERTKKGVPFHAIGVAVRDYE